MRLAIVAAAVLAFAGSATAATQKVGPNETLTSVGEAVAAAAMGDTIVVLKGRYYENVVVGTQNLTIIGKGAILDGNVTGTDGICLDLMASGITVRGISFRNGSNHIRSSGGTLTVTKCVFTDSNSHAINVTAGDGLIVTGCKFYGVGSRGVSARANQVIVTKCWLRSSDSDGFDVTISNNSRFEGNTLLFVEEGNAIGVIFGNNARVLKNKIFNCDSNAIDILGNDAYVIGNTVTNISGSRGVYVQGTSARIEKNRISDVGGGIECYGNDADVIGNTVTNAGYDTGIYVEGTSARIEKNKISDVGGGIECYGDGAEVLSNKITGIHEGSAGVEVEADDMLVQGNSVTQGSDDACGFDLSSRTATGQGLIEGNRASELIDAGFYLNSDNGGNRGGGIHGVVVRDCSVRNCGAEDEFGFYVSGFGNTLERLSVMNMDSGGFLLYGDGNDFNSCLVRNVNGDGFRVYQSDGNTFTNCEAMNCGSDGFDNRDGTNTMLTGGKYRGDRFDIVNNFPGGATMTLLNVNYDTGGTMQANEDD